MGPDFQSGINFFRDGWFVFMRNFLLALGISVIVFLISGPVSALAAGGGSAVSLARVGSPAPDFTLEDVNGKKVSLSQFRGKVVVLNFWATWCPPCRAEMPSMEKLNKAMQGKDFVMLAVNVEEDGRDRVKDFLRQNPHSFTVLVNGAEVGQSKYGVFQFPETFIIRPDGVVAEKVIGMIDWNSQKVVRFIDFLISG